MTRSRVGRVVTEAWGVVDADGAITVTLRDDEALLDRVFAFEETEDRGVETATRLEALLLLEAVPATSTVRLTRRAGIAALLDWGAGCVTVRSAVCCVDRLD